MPGLTMQNWGVEEIGPNPYRQAGLGEDYVPTTGEVSDNYAGEAMYGVGTGNADYQARKVTQSENASEAKEPSIFSPFEAPTADDTKVEMLRPEDKPFNNEEEFKKSGKYNSSIKFYKGLTPKSAQVLSQTADEDQARNFVISRASTAQDVAGVATALTVGVLEPKNIAYGLVTAGIGSGAVSTIRAKRIADAFQKLSKPVQGTVLGGVDGLVSAALAEPSNRYSAEILKRDYDMTDSMFNIATSMIFGAGVRGVPTYIAERIKTDRINRAKVVTDSLDEIDAYTKQLVTGQEPDVTHLRAVRDGDLKNAPIERKAEAAESFVHYTESDDFKTRFDGSKVFDEDGAPIRVYHGTNQDFAAFDPDLRQSAPVYGQGSYFAVDPKLASEFAGRGSTEGGNVRPAYLNLKNPYISDANEFRRKFAGVDKSEISERLKAEGYDGIMITRGTDPKNTEFVAFAPDQIIPAFGNDDMNAIIAKRNNENVGLMKEMASRQGDPTNSTAYAPELMAEIDKFTDLMAEDKTTEQLIQYEEEIAALHDQGLLSEDDLVALDHLKTLKEEDMINAYDSLYLCLTKG